MSRLLPRLDRGGRRGRSAVATYSMFTLGAIVAMTAVALVIQGRVLSRSIDALSAEKVTRLGTLVAVASAEPILSYDFATVEKYAAGLRGDPDVAQVMFVAPDGKRLNSEAGSDPGVSEKKWGKETLAAATIRTFEFPIGSGDQKLATLVIQAHDLESRATTARVRNLLLLVFGVSTALLGIGLRLLLRRLLVGPLGKIIDALRDGSVQVARSAAGVSASSRDLSGGATTQAASLEETSASMEELASTTARNAEHSGQAAALVAEEQEQVRTANATLDGLVASMAEIGESSTKVTRIIKTIDEIAFQTNILALNAAVEAARAGEAGMGFAVVADEVRNLAHRSAQAAKETETLVEESAGSARAGVAKVDAVTAAMAQITATASRLRHLVDEVSESSRQQAQGIGQVSQAVSQMEKITQSTAATAEESAAAAELLNNEADSTMQLVAQLESLIGRGQTAAGVARSEAKAPTPFSPRRTAPASVRSTMASAEDKVPRRTGTFGDF